MSDKNEKAKASTQSPTNNDSSPAHGKGPPVHPMSMSKIGPSVKHGFFSNLYYPLKNMRESKQLLLANKLKMEALEWGTYQKTLVSSSDDWEPEVFDQWDVAVTGVKDSLTSQPGATRGTTRFDDLNSVIQICFKADPPIPMIILIDAKAQTDAAPTLHDFQHVFIKNGQGNSVLMVLTMVCPYGS